MSKILTEHDFCPDCGSQLVGREVIDDLAAGYGGDGELRMCLNENCEGQGVFGVSENGALI